MSTPTTLHDVVSHLDTLISAMLPEIQEVKPAFMRHPRDKAGLDFLTSCQASLLVIRQGIQELRRDGALAPDLFATHTGYSDPKCAAANDPLPKAA